MWVVKLTKEPKINDFGSCYFPRQTYYKKDAKMLALEVKWKGGEAKIEKYTAAH